MLRDYNCKESYQRTDYHDHIVTGDFRFIENKSLRKLISKRSSFQEPKTINWIRCQDITMKEIEDYRQRLSSSNNNIDKE